MDDRTAGLVLRALRRRRGWRQLDLAARAGCSQALVSKAEAGALAGTSIGVVRRLFAALDARVDLAPRWRGADLERLVDEAHAALVAAAARRLELAGWVVALEVTYSEFGERGSIDILALLPSARAVLVLEAKTQLGSAEAIGRKLDEKARLVPGIVRRRHGWSPALVGQALVMPESSQLRRTVAATPVLSRMLPGDARLLHRWLQAPSVAIAVTWFLSDIRPRNARRVRGPIRAAARAGAGADRRRLSTETLAGEPPTPDGEPLAADPGSR